MPTTTITQNRLEIAPKVTVLLPVYNAQQYITESIDSILKQTFCDFELLIINDGSTDASCDIIKEYNDNRIRFIDNKQNRGLIAVLNQGLHLAKGTYIARMDADDIALPERLAKQIAFLDKEQEIGILGTQIEHFGDTKKKISHFPLKVGILDLLRNCCISHPTVMLRKSIFQQYQLYYSEEYGSSEDYELWSRAIHIMKIANLPEVLLKYRWHGTNISILKKQQQKENTTRIKQHLFDFLVGDTRNKKTLVLCTGFGSVKFDVCLFGLLPVFTLKTLKKSKYIYLFKFIPLVKIKNDTILLFHFIPIASIKDNE